jgi:iron complex transport system ATP-binding protein
MKKALDIKNLTIGFKNPIFRNISCELLPGSMTAIMGVNGAGKSCLLKTIGKLIEKKDGNIKIFDKSIEDYTHLEFAQIAALVLTEKIQVDFLRVVELVSLGRSPYTGWSGELNKQDDEVVNDVLKLTGVWNLKDRFFAELSDGQKQKALIARALAQSPKLLILDEPTTFLDIPSKIDLLKLLKKIAQENHVAVLMSTHDLELMKIYADQIWLMGADESFSTGSPAEIEAAGLIQKHFTI